MTWLDACEFAALPDEDPVGVRIGTTALVLVRRGQRIHAVDALCPHKFGPLEDGTMEAGRLACPLHDAHFDLQTGLPRDTDGWAPRLRVYEARVEAGRVQVLL